MIQFHSKPNQALDRHFGNFASLEKWFNRVLGYAA